MDKPGVEHDLQHTNLNDAIRALEEKVGINNSQIAASLDFRIRQLEQNGGTGNGLQYKGVWNATNNTPAIPAASAANKGWYYVVSGLCPSNHGYANVPAVDFNASDWIVSNGVAWEKADHTDRVASVAGRTGVVVLTTSDVAEGSRLYFTEARVQSSMLTGLDASAGGALLEADSIVQAFGKLEFRVALNDTKVTGEDRMLRAGDTMTGTLDISLPDPANRNGITLEYDGDEAGSPAIAFRGRMAGSPYDFVKIWGQDAILFVDNQLQFSGANHAGLRVNNLTTAERNVCNSSLGSVIYNKTTNRFQGKSNVGWLDLLMSNGGMMTGELAVALGEINNDIRFLRGSAKWNNAAITFAGITLDIDDAQSAGTSKFLICKKNTEERFSLTKDGRLTLGNRLGDMGGILYSGYLEIQEDPQESILNPVLKSERRGFFPSVVVGSTDFTRIDADGRIEAAKDIFVQRNITLGTAGLDDEYQALFRNAVGATGALGYGYDPAMGGDSDAYGYLGNSANYFIFDTRLIVPKVTVKWTGPNPDGEGNVTHQAHLKASHFNDGWLYTLGFHCDQFQTETAKITKQTVGRLEQLTVDITPQVPPANTAIDFNWENWKRLSFGPANVQFTTANLAAGKWTVIFITNDSGAARSYTFPDDWNWIDAKPLLIASGKKALLHLYSQSTLDSGVWARYAAQA